MTFESHIKTVTMIGDIDVIFSPPKKLYVESYNINKRKMDESNLIKNHIEKNVHTDLDRREI